MIAESLPNDRAPPTCLERRLGIGGMMKNWFLWLIAGSLSLVGGCFALANPMAATLSATILAGWTFILVGVLTLVSSLRDQAWRARILALVLGILVMLMGVNLVAQPLSGSIGLTVVVACMLLAVGVFRIILGVRVKLGQLRWALFASGAISLILALMIFANFPQSALVVLGVFLAIELISNGISLIALALARKSGAY